MQKSHKQNGTASELKHNMSIKSPSKPKEMDSYRIKRVRNARTCNSPGAFATLCYPEKCMDQGKKYEALLGIEHVSR